MYVGLLEKNVPFPFLVLVSSAVTTLFPPDFPPSVRMHELEPVRPAILPVQPGLSIGEAACYATPALWRVGAVEEGNVLVSDVSEPASGTIAISKRQSGSHAHGEVLRTNESCSCPQTVQGQCYALVHLPTARRRSLQPYPGG